MFNRMMADILVTLHFGFIVFVLLGGLLLLKYRWLVLLHVPAMIWGVLVEFYGWYCPLTEWENGFRRAADQAGYRNGFVEHYLIPIIYPVGLNSDIQTALGLLVILINLLIYGYVGRSYFKSSS